MDISQLERMIEEKKVEHNGHQKRMEHFREKLWHIDVINWIFYFEDKMEEDGASCWTTMSKSPFKYPFVGLNYSAVRYISSRGVIHRDFRDIKALLDAEAAGKKWVFIAELQIDADVMVVSNIDDRATILGAVLC